MSVVSSAVLARVQSGLGLGLYFVHAVVREPHPVGSQDPFRSVPILATPLSPDEVALDAEETRGFDRHAHQNKAPMEKSAILVC